MKSPTRGNSDVVPNQTLTFTAAVTVDKPKGPVKYVIKFEMTPKYANFSTTSTPEYYIYITLKISKTYTHYLRKSLRGLTIPAYQ